MVMVREYTDQMDKFDIQRASTISENGLQTNNPARLSSLLLASPLLGGGGGGGRGAGGGGHNTIVLHQSHYTNSRNNLHVPRPRLDLFKTSISFDGTSLWNSLPQNIKSCISLLCFKRNLHKNMSENNLSPNLDGFV